MGYYRLKIVDFDGTMNYSKVIMGIQNASIWTHYIDGNDLVLSGYADQNIPLTWRLYDIQGRLLATGGIDISAGLSVYRLPLPPYKGMVFFQMLLSNTLTTWPLMRG